MRHSCGERRSVIESELWLALRELELLLEGFNLLPVFEHLFFFFREIGLVRNYRLTKL